MDSSSCSLNLVWKSRSQHRNFDRRRTFVIISVEKVKWNGLFQHVYTYIYISCINFDLVFPSLRFFSPQKHRIEIQIKHWQRENENAKISKIRRKISMEKFYALVEKKKEKGKRMQIFETFRDSNRVQISFVDRISERVIYLNVGRLKIRH